MMIKPPHAFAVDRSNPLTRGLVGAWFFTETSGLSVYDISGYENHGTRGGFAANTGFAAGPNGVLQDFNEGNGASADPRIDCGTKAVLTDMTEFTFIGRIFPKTTGRGNGARLFSKHSVKNFNVSVNTSNNIDLAITRATTNALARSANNTVEMNVWQTYAGRYNGTDGPRIYKAKEFGRFAEVSYASRTVGAGADSADGSGNFILGNRNNSAAWDRPLDGLYDWALIFNRFLTLEELQAIHERPFALIARARSHTIFVPMGSSPQTVSPSAIASGEAFGTATLTPGAVTVSPSAIGSAEAFGTPTIVQDVAPTGIPSDEAFGTASLSVGPVTVSPSSIGSAEAFGTASVFGDQTVTDAGAIASAEAFGTATIQPGTVTLLPLGIGTLEAFGTATVEGGDKTVYPTGIETAEAFGTPTVEGGQAGKKMGPRRRMGIGPR